MYDFQYHRAASLDDAAAHLAANPEAKLLAGGQTLIPVLKQRLAHPAEVIDLGRLPDLRGIAVENGAVVIGAMTTHAAVASSSEVAATIPALAGLASEIGDAQVRNRGTIGGSIANADPAADYPAAVVGLDATIETNRRRIRADDFFQALFTTALEEGEIILRVSFPIPDTAGYAKFAQPASRFAVAGVMVARTGGAVRVAVTGAGPSVFRLPAMEAALAASFTASSLDGVSVSADGLNEDLHATAAYRAHLIKVMAKRAVEACG